MEASTATIGEFGFEVKFWWAADDGVTALRPSHCAACGVAAHRGDGRLRLHGHGSRERTVWGPQMLDDGPALTSIRVRRYKCTACGAARTALPRGLASRVRYSLSAIALALTAWAVWLWSAARVRARMSPWRIVGPSEATRWASLRRWARRTADLFGLPAPGGTEATVRQAAARAAQLVRARGPTDGTDDVRVVIGAHVG